MENKWYLKPKEKSEVQFNGETSRPSWTEHLIFSVEQEFDTRFDELKKLYDELSEEIQLNNLIYSSEIRFKPVVGNSYYLYRKNGNHFLSLIAPWEWKQDFVVGVKLNHNGKWIKIQ